MINLICTVFFAAVTWMFVRLSRNKSSGRDTRNLYRMCGALTMGAALLSITACAPTHKWTPAPAGLMLGAAADTAVSDVPPLPAVASWLAYYRYIAFPKNELLEINSAYPTSGTPVNWFRWQAEFYTPGYNVPVEMANQATAKIEVFVPAHLREMFRIRLQGVDAEGRIGPWSLYGADGDTLRPGEAPE